MSGPGVRPLALGSWRDVLGVDVRSLALFRVLLALVVLADLVVRAADLGAFYTDEGIVPRIAHLEQFDWLLEMPMSVHLAGGSAWSQVLLLSIQAVAAVSMLVGYRTRVATFLVWFLVTSLQLRNLYIGLGADALLRMLLLWGVFLPLGARWSVDERQEGSEVGSSQIVSVATVALLVQIGVVYFGAGLAKLDVPAWRDGTALAMIMDDEVRATTLGTWLSTQSGLCRGLSVAVLAAELAGPLLLLVPIAFVVLRTTVVVAFVAMNMGFALTLNVGLFPWIATVGFVALLPSGVWERGGSRIRGIPLGDSVVEGLAARLPPRSRAVAASRRASFVRDAVCAVLLLFVVVFNVGVLRDPAYRPPGSIEWLGRSLFLQQAWKMFARPASRTGWIAIEGRLRDARTVDLMADGGAIPDLEDALAGTGARPDVVSAQYANERWRNFLSRAVLGTDTNTQLLLYGRYVCRSWNGVHTGGDQLTTFQLLWHVRELPAPPASRDYETQTIWRHDCFG